TRGEVARRIAADAFRSPSPSHVNAAVVRVASNACTRAGSSDKRAVDGSLGWETPVFLEGFIESRADRSRFVHKLPNVSRERHPGARRRTPAARARLRVHR